MIVSMIAAMSRNRMIGRNNQLLWRIKEDLARFKQLTWAKPVIMGRKTFESIGRALPGRLNIVISRNDNLSLPEGVLKAHSIEEAFALCGAAEEVFVLGGGEIYRQALERTDRIYLTVIDQDAEGDTAFPEFSTERFKEKRRESHPGPPAFDFVLFERS